MVIMNNELKIENPSDGKYLTVYLRNSVHSLITIWDKQPELVFENITNWQGQSTYFLYLSQILLHDKEPRLTIPFILHCQRILFK